MTGPKSSAKSDPDGPNQRLAQGFAEIIGGENVLTDADARRGYAHDRLPFANFCERKGRLAGVAPRLVLRPADADQVARVVRFAREQGVQLIPFGNGSGVLGGAVPISEEATVDLRRLDGIVSIDPVNAMATVRAGMNGAEFETALNEAGYTSGHLPQSIEISTVGGWAACRGGGQASSRYGKIEDIVVGLKAVLPDGTPLEVRPGPHRAVGPSIIDLLVGSEGTLGIITELSLRIWKKPEVERGVVLAFPTLDAALNAAREIMQAEIRPCVARLYDQVESAERVKGIALFEQKPFLAVFVFSGAEPLVDAEQRMALDIAARHGAEIGPQKPYEEWRANRYVAFSQKWQAAGYYNDTIEITGRWSDLPTMYDAMAAAAREICPEIHFGAHWSHIYPEGACQYMTIRLPQMDHERALDLHARLWEAIQSLTLRHGGSISHHHGVGVFRNPWIGQELGAGLDALQAIKDALDPGNLMNPGKLGLRAPAGAAVVRHGR